MQPLAAFDVDYREDGSAQAAAVLFDDWSDPAPTAEFCCTVASAAPYVPGSFYQRELPLLLELMQQLPDIRLAVVDGYVQLGKKPGLGLHLWEALKRRIPVAGVAKTAFREAPAELVYRGASQRPLYVTTVDLDAAQIAQQVAAMHGPHRIPTLLRRVDRLARS